MPVPPSMLLKIALKAGAKKFGEKAGEALFKEIFGDVFGSGSGVTASEMKNILYEALEVFADEIKLHIDQALAQERVKDAQLALLNLAAAVEDFSVAPEAQVDLLDEAARDGRNTVNAFLEIGAPAIEHYIFAVTLYISVYEARADYIDPDNKIVISQRILPVALKHYQGIREDILNSAQQRIKINERSTWGPPSGETITTIYSLLVDGQRVAGAAVIYPPMGEVRGEESLAALFERERDERARLKEETERRLQAADDMVNAWQQKYQVDAEAMTLLRRSPGN